MVKEEQTTVQPNCVVIYDSPIRANDVEIKQVAFSEEVMKTIYDMPDLTDYSSIKTEVAVKQVGNIPTWVACLVIAGSMAIGVTAGILLHKIIKRKKSK